MLDLSIQGYWSDWLINQSRLDRYRKISVRLIKTTFRKLLTT